MDQLWNEIQAYLNNRLPEEQVEWLHYNSERIARVLMQVSAGGGEGETENGRCRLDGRISCVKSTLEQWFMYTCTLGLCTCLCIGF